MWDLMERSSSYSVQETFVDTPTREQGQFLHDTVNISYGLMASRHERVATRQAIRRVHGSARNASGRTGNDIGRYNAVYPNGDGKRDIPDFTEVVPDWMWRYYMETGDLALLADTYDNLSGRPPTTCAGTSPTTGPTQGLVTQLTRRQRAVPVRHRRLAGARALRLRHVGHGTTTVNALGGRRAAQGGAGRRG